MNREHVDTADHEIAVVGLSARFPGAPNVDVFWDNLRNGVESITIFSDEELRASGLSPSTISEPNYVKAGAILDGVEMFDASFFGYSPREAERMDPQHRLFLEAGWAALENAGFAPEQFHGAIGVYAGSGLNTYLLNNLLAGRSFLGSMHDLQTLMGGDKDFLTTRLSYQLGLTGPSVVVQTTCSTALVAVCQACQSLMSRQCDLALAGGVTVRVPQRCGYQYQPEAIFSPDGHCRTFDAHAAGTVFGSGLGIVVLRRLSDALADGDTIHAVIKGWAINNDGSMKVGYTAPSIDGQAQAISMAQTMAGVTPDSIGYVEAHGTATALGDPIEVAALTRAFRRQTDKKGFCALGSVKSNFGHLDTAAGIAGLIKTILSVKHGTVPATLHFKSPNPNLELVASPFYVNATTRAWADDPTPRRAGVSSFGIGGTNAHVVVEEATSGSPAKKSRPFQLLLISAKTESALETATENLVNHLQRNTEVELADAGFTMQVGRRAFDQRRAIVCESREALAAAVASNDPQRVWTAKQPALDTSIVFMFPGQGSQYRNMGRGIYESEPLFQERVDECAEQLRSSLGLDIREVLYPASADIDSPSTSLDQTRLTQPALFVIEYALAQLWMSWGIRPQAMIGHSIGEYVAACLAGVFTLNDALMLVAERGRLMQNQPGGSMMAVSLPVEELKRWLGPELALAAVNAPSLCVVSGPHDAVDRLESRLTPSGVAARRLRTSHAFHSAMMDPVLPAFADRLRGITLRPPGIPFMSNLTGRWITEREATDPQYWVQHLRHTVQFAAGAIELLADSSNILLEVGPGSTLCNLATQCDQQATGGGDQKSPTHRILSSMRHPQDRQADSAILLSALGRLWIAGVTPDWAGFHAGRHPCRIPLPTYPFERKRFWIEPETRETIVVDSGRKKANVTDWFYSALWKRSNLRVARPTIQESEKPSERRNWLVFCDNEGVGKRLVTLLQELGQTVAAVSAGTGFTQSTADDFTVNPTRAADYRALITALQSARRFPERVVHLWGVGRQVSEVSQQGPDSVGSFARWKREYRQTQYCGFYSIAFLARALAGQNDANALQLFVATSGVQDVTGDEDLRPERATVLGACGTIGRELPWISCRSLDLDSPATPEDAAEIAERLLAEVLSGSADSVVAHRGNHRWIQTIAPLRLEAPAAKPPRLRERGVYLFTGGLGGVGLELAGYLARTVQARLVLIGRRWMPAFDDWDGWLSTHGANDSISRIIVKIREIEAVGGRVLVVQANVADFDEMQSAMGRAQSQFGTIHGIIHAAGVPGSQMLEETTEEASEAVFEAKVHGAQVLYRLCSRLELDFWVSCSSVITAIEAAGQSAYAGANAFLDAFAQRRRSRDGLPMTAVGWDVWGDVGMGVNAITTESHATFAHRSLKDGMRSSEGVEVFQRILGSSEAHVLVSTMDLPARILELQSRPSRASADDPREVVSDDSIKKLAPMAPAVQRPNRLIEQSVAEIWRQLLGSKQVNVTDNFFDAGGNSLIATQLLNRLRKDFEKASLSLRVLFDNPTVAGVAEVIGKAYPPPPEVDTPALTADSRVPPTLNPIEQAIGDDWRQLLGIKKIDLGANFFDLGGNSLIATQLLNRLKQRYPKAELTLRILFDHPTVGGLAGHINRHTRTEVALEAPPFRNRLSQALPRERLDILRDYLKQEIGQALGINPSQVPEDEKLETFDRSRITSHLIVALKRDLDLPLYAPEIRGRFSVAQLAPFIDFEFEQFGKVQQRRIPTTRLPAETVGHGERPKSPGPAATEKNATMVFVLCPPRTGSTLFRVMLSGHSRLFCPPELTLLGHADMRQWRQDPHFALFSDGLVRALMTLKELDLAGAQAFVDGLIEQNGSIQQVYGLLQQCAHPRLLVDKTPAYALSLQTLQSAEAMFDRPKYVVLLRHPKAMIDSFVRNRFDRLRGMEGDPYAIAEQHWRLAVANMLEFTRSIDPARAMQVRFEELVTDPIKVMSSVCAFLELEFEPGVIRPYEHGQMFSGPGDPNLFQRGKIDEGLATVHQRIQIPGGLTDETVRLAASLGYELPSG